MTALTNEGIADVRAWHEKTAPYAEQLRDWAYIASARIGDLLDTLRALEAEVARLTEENARLAASRRVPELDNHHNALACGYCAGPLKERAEQAEARLARLTGRALHDVYCVHLLPFAECSSVHQRGDEEAADRLRAALADAGGREGEG
jgi:hypothetical protein